MTIVVSFPKGVVAQPSPVSRIWFWAKDNPAAIAGVAGLLLLAAYLYFVWRRVGRDPKAGPKFPRYEAPAGLGPGGVRYLDRMRYDNRCFAAALLGLGASGLVRIRHDLKGYDVERTEKAQDPNDVEQGLLRGLFKQDVASVHISREHSPALQAVRDGYRDALKLHYDGKLFSRNLGAQALGWAIAAATLVSLFVLSASTLLGFAIAAVMVVLVLLFYFLLPAYSIEGRKLQDGIEGLGQYLSVAEKDDLARMKAPPQTPQEFARFLPYAVALDVEKTWAERFAAVLGAAAVAAAVKDYYDSGSGSHDFGSFSGSLSSLSDTVSSASTPPGSSSGSDGGGGSSGGGGGGGGGSGW